MSGSNNNKNSPGLLDIVFTTNFRNGKRNPMRYRTLGSPIHATPYIFSLSQSLEVQDQTSPAIRKPVFHRGERDKENPDAMSDTHIAGYLKIQSGGRK